MRAKVLKNRALPIYLASLHRKNITDASISHFSRQKSCRICPLCRAAAGRRGVGI